MKLNIILLFLLIFVSACELTTERIPENLVAKDQKNIDNTLMNGATGDGMFVEQGQSIVCADSVICELDCNSDTKLDCTDLECQKDLGSRDELVNILLDHDIDCQ